MTRKEIILGIIGYIAVLYMIWASIAAALNYYN
jgi:hypothetical protein